MPRAPESAPARARGGSGADADADDGTDRFRFPVDYVPPSARRAPSEHVDLMENDDGVLRADACATWSHPHHPKHMWACRIEWDEWMLANAFVHEGDHVIEFGARYGTTSCVLSRNVGRRGQVVAVEPDASVHGYLLRNREEHGCSYHAVLGTVSDGPLRMGRNEGYAQQTTTAGGEAGGAGGLPYVNRSYVEDMVGARINIALIDCEGCIPFVDRAGLLDEAFGVGLVLLEEDAIDYREWHRKLYARGYRCRWYVRDTYDPVNVGWSRNMRHSAWAHARVVPAAEGGGGAWGGGPRPLPPACEEYVKLRGFDEGQIVCDECPKL